MSYYLQCDDEAKTGGDVATNSGLTEFRKFVEGADGAKELKLLVEHGWSQDLPTLRSDLESLDVEGDVASIAEAMLEVLDQADGAETVVLTDGVGVAEEDEEEADAGKSAPVPIVKSSSHLTRDDIKTIKTSQTDKVLTIATRKLAAHFAKCVESVVDELAKNPFTPKPDHAAFQAEDVMADLTDENDMWQEDLNETARDPIFWAVLQGGLAEQEFSKRFQPSSEKKRTPEEIMDELGVELPPGTTFDDYPEWLIKAAEDHLIETFNQDYWEQIVITTRDDIEVTLRKGIEDGYSIADIVKEIRKRHGEEYSKSRATNVARSEMTGAMNAGHTEGLRQLEEELGVSVGKEWLSVLGSTTRPEHAAMDGKTTRGPDDDFDVDGYKAPYPGHFSLPARLRCNCQCTIISAPQMEE